MLLYPLDEMAVPGVRVGGRPGELGDERAEQVGDAAGQPIADGGRVGVRAGGEGVEEGQQDGSEPLGGGDGRPRHLPDVLLRHPQQPARYLEQVGAEALRVVEGVRPSGVVQHETARRYRRPAPFLRQYGAAGHLYRHPDLRLGLRGPCDQRGAAAHPGRVRLQRGHPQVSQPVRHQAALERPVGQRHHLHRYQRPRHRRSPEPRLFRIRDRIGRYQQAHLTAPLGCTPAESAWSAGRPAL